MKDEWERGKGRSFVYGDGGALPSSFSPLPPPVFFAACESAGDSDDLPFRLFAFIFFLGEGASLCPSLSLK